MEHSAWTGFNSGEWSREVNVNDFIDKNYTPYEGDEAFLSAPSDRTLKLWDKVKELMWQEHQQNGVLDIDTSTVSTITSHGPVYITRAM